MRFVTFSQIALVVAMLAPLAAQADQLPAISGMALLEDDSYLVVVDTKSNKDGRRVGVLQVSEEHGLLYEELTVAWRGRLSNDLEAAAAVPGKPGEFLIAESGNWTDRETGAVTPGLIYHLSVKRDGSHWRAELLGQLEVPAELHEVEGIALYEARAPETPAYATATGWMETVEPDTPAALPIAPPQTHYLVMGTRGAEIAYASGKLYWGTLDLSSHTLKFEWQTFSADEADFAESMNDPWLRSITDLYVDQEGTMWASAAVDNGDMGMFHSYVYRIGDYAPWSDSFFSSHYYSMHDAIWSFSGLKIEALGAPMFQGSVLSIATDDEAFGGVWRPLGPPPSLR